MASLSFSFGQPPALRASPFHGKGVDGLLIPLLPPSSGRRWRVAPEVGFALFRLRPTPCPSGIPLPWEGGRWVTHPVSPSFLWKEVARSAGGWLHSLSSSANPLPFGHPLPWEGGWYEMTSISTLCRCQSKSGPRIGVRQSFQPASVRWFYCTHFGQKTQGKS